ncbi:MAG TPA: ABC transporter substrate-binding protein [Nitrospira sp.]|nr:ABC transporter substrate-binding protein [Nitrospira sp.]
MTFARRQVRCARPSAWERRLAFHHILGMLVWLLFGTSFASATEIIILKSSDIAAYNQAINGFKSALPSGMILSEFDLQGDLEKGRKLARKIRASDPALVFAVGLKAAKAAQLEIVDIPVVYSMVLDPSKYGLTTPNMTGILLEVPVERQLAMIRTLLPNLKHIGTLYDPTKTTSLIDEARRLLKPNGMELIPLQINNERDVPGGLRALLPSVDALWLVPDSTVLNDESLRFILNTALEERVPVIGFSREFARSGALLCLSVNYGDIGRQAGQLSRKLLDGQLSLPMKPWHPERIETSLNLKTAKFLGIEIPRELEQKADELY